MGAVGTLCANYDWLTLCKFPWPINLGGVPYVESWASAIFYDILGNYMRPLLSTCCTHICGLPILPGLNMVP